MCARTTTGAVARCDTVTVHFTLLGYYLSLLWLDSLVCRRPHSIPNTNMHTHIVCIFLNMRICRRRRHLQPTVLPLGSQINCVVRNGSISGNWLINWTIAFICVCAMHAYTRDLTHTQRGHQHRWRRRQQLWGSDSNQRNTILHWNRMKQIGRWATPE